MIYDHLRRTATPRARSTCPTCSGELIAKCGTLVAWHWAHVANDCDPWSEPESEWHLSWKRHYERLGADIEVVMGRHRADVVLPDGRVVELQSTYLGADDVAEREQFYGRMLWVYRCHWQERLHWGERGFWWKHGSKAMATHRRPVWWHNEDEMLLVRLNVVDQIGDWGGVDSQRVLGRVLDRRPAPTLPVAA